MVLLSVCCSPAASSTRVPDPVGRLVAVRLVVQLLVAGFVIVTACCCWCGPSLLEGQAIGRGERLAQAALSLIGVSGPVEFRPSGSTTSPPPRAHLRHRRAPARRLLPAALGRAASRARLRGRRRGIRELLARHGRADSLGYFALRRDKSVVFSASGKAAVAYRVLAGVALASGDPLGRRRGVAWGGHGVPRQVPALRVGAGGARAARRPGRGCGRARVGWTRWSSATRPSSTSPRSPCRAARCAPCARLSRASRRAGYETPVRRLRDVPDDELVGSAPWWSAGAAGPTSAGSRWRSRGPRMPRSTRTRCWCVAAAEGELRGLLQFVPWGPNGLSLDLMIRDPAVRDNGLNELLIADLLAACRRLEVARVSLNFAVFRSGLERRRAHRSRPGRAVVGATAADRVAVVADRDAVPLQRPLLPGMGAAVPRVRRRARPAPHRRRRLRGRGLRRPPARAATSAAPMSTDTDPTRIPKSILGQPESPRSAWCDRQASSGIRPEEGTPTPRRGPAEQTREPTTSGERTGGVRPHRGAGVRASTEGDGRPDRFRCPGCSPSRFGNGTVTTGDTRDTAGGREEGPWRRRRRWRAPGRRSSRDAS